MGADGHNHGMKVMSLTVKTDLNSSSNILALSAAPKKSFPGRTSGGTLMLSCRRDLMKHQKGLPSPSSSPPMTLLFTYSALVFLQSLENCFLYSLNCAIFTRSLLALAFLYIWCFFLDFLLSSRVDHAWCWHFDNIFKGMLV